MARQSDPVRCVEHGVNRIAEGDENFQIDGKPAALDGHHANCGCTLVSRFFTLSVS
ncbi:PAAR domain-containing protein [Burkholderia multivorans]|uniref:PAAR domain-containing protein n=1 Tax=Burkholderia multivorans TaxID=87883 RepID=UPI001FC8E9A4|nr:PAAR domain-containing protein [Burkholderia multivorans]